MEPRRHVLLTNSCDPVGVPTWASLRYLVYGFGFAVGASVLSGIYPAWKATNVRPVKALGGYSE